MGRTTRVLTDGIYFGEGPRWRDGRLWFSDFYAHAVKSVSLAGDLRTEFEIDDQPSGLGWAPDGSLLVVSMTRRQVLRRAPDGAIAVHADLGHIATFHCNDMVVDAAGGAYVGNFGFDLDAEIAARGIPDVLASHATAKLAYVAPDGQARVAAEDMHFPNGPVITPRRQDPDPGRDPGRRPHRLRHRAERRPFEPPGLGAAQPARPGRRLPRRGRRNLGRQPDRAGMRAVRRGRRGAGSDRHRPTLLRLHARRRRRSDALHADRRKLGSRAGRGDRDGQDPSGRSRQSAGRPALVISSLLFRGGWTRRSLGRVGVSGSGSTLRP